MESFQRGDRTGFHGVEGNEGPGLWGSCLWLRDARQARFLVLLCTGTEGSGPRRRASPQYLGLGEEGHDGPHTVQGLSLRCLPVCLSDSKALLLNTSEWNLVEPGRE